MADKMVILTSHPEFPPGTADVFIEAAFLLSDFRRPQQPGWRVPHFSIVQMMAQEASNELEIDNTLIPTSQSYSMPSHRRKILPA
jgi:hypothetical protein